MHSESITVRLAQKQDAAVIAEIYNAGIAERVATFETRLRTPSDIESWFDSKHPIVVIESSGRVIGFASSSNYRTRECYAGIAEFSVYVTPSRRGEGLGRQAMELLICEATAAGFWKLLSRIFLENQASRQLMLSLGFREVGVYEKHGKLDGEWRDVVIVEKLL